MYRKFNLKPGQQAPFGSTGKILLDNFIVWKGTPEDFPSEIESYEMSETEINSFLSKDFEILLDGYIDSIAQRKGYDDRISCISYAAFENKWQAESVAFGIWRSNCYEAAHQFLSDIKAGLREILTEQEFISELPEMVWPA